MIDTKRYDVLAGYYGFMNFGDDLFRDVLSSALEIKEWANPRVSSNTLSAAPKLTRNFGAVKNILQARSITLGGGSILGSKSRFSIREVEAIVSGFKGVPYAAIGVGLLENRQENTFHSISKMSWVGLRSEREYMELREDHSNIHYTTDIAYATFNYRPQAVGASTRSDALTIIPAGVGNLGAICHSKKELGLWIRGNVLRFSNANLRVKILLLQPGNQADTAACKALAAELKEHGVSSETVIHSGSDQTIQQIAGSAFVFTDRLHGAIVSHLCRVPFRLSIHHQKCSDFLADISHPDAPSMNRFANDHTGSGIETIKTWNEQQEKTVRKHVDLATEAIEGWLLHLEKRVA